jgi:hypothetical protein
MMQVPVLMCIAHSSEECRLDYRGVGRTFILYCMFTQGNLHKIVNVQLLSVQLGFYFTFVMYDDCTETEFLDLMTIMDVHLHVRTRNKQIIPLVYYTLHVLYTSKVTVWNLLFNCPWLECIIIRLFTVYLCHAIDFP